MSPSNGQPSGKALTSGTSVYFLQLPLFPHPFHVPFTSPLRSIFLFASLLLLLFAQLLFHYHSCFRAPKSFSPFFFFTSFLHPLFIFLSSSSVLSSPHTSIYCFCAQDCNYGGQRLLSISFTSIMVLSFPGDYLPFLLFSHGSFLHKSLRCSLPYHMPPSFSCQVKNPDFRCLDFFIYFSIRIRDFARMLVFMIVNERIFFWEISTSPENERVFILHRAISISSTLNLYLSLALPLYLLAERPPVHFTILTIQGIVM